MIRAGVSEFFFTMIPKSKIKQKKIFFFGGGGGEGGRGMRGGG